MVSLTPAELAITIVASATAGYLARYGIALWKSREEDQQFKPDYKPERWDG